MKNPLLSLFSHLFQKQAARPISPMSPTTVRLLSRDEDLGHTGWFHSHISPNFRGELPYNTGGFTGSPGWPASGTMDIPSDELPTGGPTGRDPNPQDLTPESSARETGPENVPTTDPSFLSQYGPLMAGGGAAGLGLGGLAYYLYNRSQQAKKKPKPKLHE